MIRLRRVVNTADSHSSLLVLLSEAEEAMNEVSVHMLHPLEASTIPLRAYVLVEHLRGDAEQWFQTRRKVNQIV